VQAHLPVHQLAFVDQQAGINEFVLNRIENFIEGHDDGLKIRLVKFQRKIRGSLQSGDGDALAP